MERLKRATVWAALAVGLSLLILFALPSYRQGEASIAGTKAEDFSLTINGKPMKLSDYRGKVVVLNFWASWCPPCVAEAPSLNKLQEYIQGKDATLLGVSVDEDSGKYEKFLKDFQVNFPTWRDPNVKDNKSNIVQGYGTELLPETYIIDRRGKIARKLVGEQKWDSPEMLEYFDAMLKDK
jgi:cytochrome c biogenesis protein CcmG, thiol:disulfide interchange protein DsbE